MTTDAQAVLQEALALGDDDRADLALELLASLDAADRGDAGEIERQWAEELDRRAARVRSGDESTEAWQLVHRRVNAELEG